LADLDLLYYRIRNNRKKKKQRIDNRKREKRHSYIYKYAYVDHTRKKKKNPMNSKKENSVVKNDNFKGKKLWLGKVIGAEQSPIESAVKLA
jgi:hypothetical protein